MPRRRDIEGDLVMGWPDRKRPSPQVRRDEQGRAVFVRSPYWELQGLITPTDLRYTFFQMQATEPIHPDDWALSVRGELEHPLRLDFAEIRKLPARTVRCVTECAGSDGNFFDYQRYGGEKPDRFSYSTPASGLVSTGEWVGVPLAAVLEEAGVRPNAVSVRAEGMDRGVRTEHARAIGSELPGVETNFDKCLPIEKALDPDTLVAWALNGEYLRHAHGGPVRLVVPGWSGNWSVKWLQELEVLDHMAPCYDQTHHHYFAQSPEDPNRVMVTALGVKAVITEPKDQDSPLPRGVHVIRGLAWSGRGAITRVEVSVDGGGTWREAHLEMPREKWLWARWSYPWNAERRGQYAITARATDEAGRVQPQTPWNYRHFHFDGIVPVDVEIE